MRLALATVLLAATAGCSTYEAARDAWHWDATRLAAPARPAAAPAGEEVARLEQERQRVRERISTEPDLRVRLALYEELHRVGLRIAAAQRR